MHVLFIGAVEFSSQALQIQIAIQTKIVGVCMLKE